MQEDKYFEGKAEEKDAEGADRKTPEGVDSLPSRAPPS